MIKYLGIFILLLTSCANLRPTCDYYLDRAILLGSRQELANAEREVEKYNACAGHYRTNPQNDGYPR